MRSSRSKAVAVAVLTLAGCGGSPGGPDPDVRDTRGAADSARNAADPALGPDRLQYDVQIRHRPGRLRGTAAIGFRNPFTAPLDHVWVRMWPNAYGSCRRLQAPVRALGGARLTARRRGCTALRFALPRPVAPGAQGDLRLSFAVRVPAGADRFGRAAGVDYLGNALPVLAVADAPDRPRLPPYSFRGDSFFSLTASWRVRLTVARGEVVASTGTETARRGGTLTLEAPRARDFALAIGPMEIQERRAGDVRVRWFSPRGEKRADARAGLGFAARSLQALAERLGPYDAPELDAVSTSGPIGRGAGVAMEYPELIMSPPFPQAVTHEVAHQWFYALVGSDQHAEPWVDETLAEYSALRLGRALHGPDRLRGCVQRDRRPRAPQPLDTSLGALERARGRAIRDTLYVEGVCALFNLTRRAGEKRMDALLRQLVERHRHGVLTGAELERELRALPGGPQALAGVGL